MFSKRSLKEIETCHPDLQKILHEAIKYFDFAVTCGHRGKEDQNRAFAEGKSKLKWPNSKHNKVPAMAVDCAPFPIDWNKRHEFYFMQGLFLGIATQMGIKIRLGIDFNNDKNLRNDSFVDGPHIELVE